MTGKYVTFAIAALFAALSCRTSWGQSVPATILQIDIENWVQYVEDTTDLSKFATNANPTPAATPTNFGRAMAIADIVAVNGQPAKGTMTRRQQYFFLNTIPSPGRAVADITRSASVIDTFEILNSDGNAIGTIMTAGVAPGAPAPGAPLAVTQGNFAVIGGTGAFLGVRGQNGQAVNSQTVSIRSASIAEDPAYRRQNGGGKVRWVMHLIPMEAPQVVANGGLPLVRHLRDSSPVAEENPATPTETLRLFVTGLGPTKPGVDPGQPFPSGQMAVVNSPLSVTVNGESATVLSAFGFPGAVDGYEVDIQLPPDTSQGIATVQVNAAWIQGAPVSIPIGPAEARTRNQ
jgi:uncharacterized protein (TIGR03437 family)